MEPQGTPAGLSVLALLTGTVLLWVEQLGLVSGRRGDRTWNEGCRNLGVQTIVRTRARTLYSELLFPSQAGEDSCCYGPARSQSSAPTRAPTSIP